MFPGIGYDPIIDYYRLKQQYVWLTPDVYYPIYEEARKYPNVTMDDVCALIQYESGNYCHNRIECMKTVVSYAGAIGLMQIIQKYHYKNGNRKDLEIPSINIRIGTKYYSICLALAKGNKKEALRFYNAGPVSNVANYRGWAGYVNPIIYTSKKSETIYNQHYEVR